MGSYKMRIINIVTVIGILSLVMLSACGVVSVSQKDPKASKVISSEFNSSARKLSENKEIIVNQIYQYIKEKHPTTADDFPKSKIGNVVSSSYQKLEFYNEKNIEEKLKIFEKDSSNSYKGVYTGATGEVRSILTEVSDRFAIETISKNEWKVDIVVNQVFLESLPNDTLFNTYTAACVAGNLASGNWLMFGGFVVCPRTVTHYVAITAFVQQDNNKPPTEVVGLGGATSASIFANNPDLVANNTASALSAAIANAVDGLVQIYERNRI